MCTLDGCGADDTRPPLVIAPADRRAFVLGLASLPLAAVLSDPALAQIATAVATETVRIKTPSGQEIEASVARPAAGETEKPPAILLIHEWWGLNNQIKSVAVELANMGYLAIAVNLFGKPAVEDPAAAKALVASVDPAAATEALTTWVKWAKEPGRSTGKVGVMGWCFGGGWALNTALATPVDATVIYYGNVAKTADQLKPLQGQVLGQFASQDKSITKDMVDGFVAAMKEAGKQDQLTVYWYDADHAFANPTGARYDALDADLAWQRTSDFLAQNLQKM